MRPTSGWKGKGIGGGTEKREMGAERMGRRRKETKRIAPFHWH
jgi:hypothetical protein